MAYQTSKTGVAPLFACTDRAKSRIQFFSIKKPHSYRSACASATASRTLQFKLRWPNIAGALAFVCANLFCAKLPAPSRAE
jgi:hypothetical protein